MSLQTHPPAELLKQIDTHTFATKNRQLVRMYANELTRIMRYLHLGQVLPIEVDKTVGKLVRFFPHLQQNHSLVDDNGHTISVLAVYADEASPHRHITYRNETTNQDYHVYIKQLHDEQRNSTDTATREIVYQDKTYRSVPEDNQVHSHLLHQEKRFGPDYIDPLEHQEILTETQAKLHRLFHTIHDITEKHTQIGDAFAFTKEDGSAYDEAKLIVNDALQASIPYTKEELRLLPRLFHQHEGKHTIFKLGEMIGYMKNALAAYKHPNYFNAQQLFAGNIIAYNLPKLISQQYSAVDPQTLQTSSYRPLDLAPVKQFLRTHIDDLMNIAVWCRQHAPEIKQKQHLSTTPDFDQTPDQLRQISNEIFSKEI